MNIRKSELKDIPVILDIFAKARVYMKSHGNPTQWEEGYPSETIVKNDIESGNSYVCVADGEVVGTFTLIIGEDPTYSVIRQGEWRSDKLYGTIHRIASANKVRGLAQMCFDFCTDQIDYLRIDTHENNKSMQAAIKKYGFEYCGVIDTRDGTERLAFDYVKLT